MTLRSALVPLTVFVAACAGSLTAEPAPAAPDRLPPGVVAEKPATGPFVPCELGFMVPYEATIPGTTAKFSMIPIAGGETSVGGPDAGSARVRLEPYWIGQHEVTWAEYQPFMDLNNRFAALQSLRRQTEEADPKATAALASRSALREAAVATPELVDGVTAPTALYDPSTTYQSGEGPDLPAVTMTHFAAAQYCKWLSSLLGQPYRLPSEAEWELAAGPSPPEAIDDYAWHIDNAEWEAHPVGQKKPNAKGLYDVFGNVAELVLDEARDRQLPAGEVVDWKAAVAWPDSKDPRIAKGGYWDAEAEEANVTGRLLTSEDDWKQEDPNIPKSPWWYSDMPSAGVGMRLVRPLNAMTPEVEQLVWNADTDDIRSDVKFRLEEGRGKLGPVSPRLPEAFQQLDSPEVQALLR
ncbi:Formylglycine-generating sulfatase enzyme [Pirellulimonas nuda]|uniref:Formylglycine-generating sulfatase enzyme n=1 Tax=Pirellulimonas nuda TaxID=2528009 RepID=A0A518DB99_9BACT|nr:SUMF1/EgtB/PvdO family nonheme iron enzyme [Pirellulimonas nuda]QDU88716.1 Formylglycine-generating sulfatase enzyme [Pirellulimonas nuda]